MCMLLIFKLRKKLNMMTDAPVDVVLSIQKQNTSLSGICTQECEANFRRV